MPPVEGIGDPELLLGFLSFPSWGGQCVLGDGGHSGHTREGPPIAPGGGGGAIVLQEYVAMGTTPTAHGHEVVPLAVLGHVLASLRWVVVEVRLAVGGGQAELVLLTVPTEGLVCPQGRGVVVLGLG